VAYLNTNYTELFSEAQINHFQFNEAQLPVLEYQVSVAPCPSKVG
jgi:hypothetical protein